MMTRYRLFPLVLLMACWPLAAHAQKLMPPSTPYGAPIGLADAKRAAEAAQSVARQNNWTMSIAIVDTAGMLVYFEHMDGVQRASGDVAIDKARSAALYKRPTKAFMNALAAGGDGLRVLALRGAVPVEGGVPLTVDGKIIGAIGLSGGAGDQDGICAEAAAAALAKR